MLNHAGRCIALLVAIVVAGCGSEGGPALGRVSGKVSLDGVPLKGVQVTFTPIEASSGRPSYGITDGSGSYELLFSTTDKGAAVGEHRVTIFTPLRVENLGLDGKAAKDPVPRKYHADSTLSEVVKEGRNEINFELSSK